MIAMKHQLRILRVYDLGPGEDGCRILVDRLWPRGIRKVSLGPFEWAKDIAPSNELRKWFGHDPERFGEFSQRYEKELDGNPQAGEFAEKVGKILKERDVLLLYSAKNSEENQAVVLKKWLEKKLKL